MPIPDAQATESTVLLHSERLETGSMTSLIAQHRRRKAGSFKGTEPVGATYRIELGNPFQR